MVANLSKKNGATLQVIPMGKLAVDAIVLAELRRSALPTIIGWLMPVAQQEVGHAFLALFRCDAPFRGWGLFFRSPDKCGKPDP